MQKAGAKFSEGFLSDDFRRLPEHMMVTLMWKDMLTATRILGVIGECKGLARLNLRGSRIGVAGSDAGWVAGELHGARSSRLELQWNSC